jgi:glycerate dehydrogenase
MNIVFLDAYTTNPGDLSWEPLQALGNLTLYDRTHADDILPRAGDAEVIITNKCLLTAPIIEALPKLKLICVAATGYNNIDLEAARSKDVQVANVANYSTMSVVQHVFALLLNHLNQVNHYKEGVRLNRWAKSEDFAYTDNPILNLSNMTMGIVGYGTIGKAVARTAVSFGMDVLACKRRPDSPDTPGVKIKSLEEVLGQSDVVSLHVPANESTFHMLDENRLNSLKQNAILINTARGSVIDEVALFNWLNKNPLALALLDVLEQEPPRLNHPLTLLNNCIITPHQAWIGQGARKKLLEGIADNINSFKKGDLVSL